MLNKELDRGIDEEIPPEPLYSSIQFHKISQNEADEKIYVPVRIKKINPLSKSQATTHAADYISHHELIFLFLGRN
jgi:hypothetical protein